MKISDRKARSPARQLPVGLPVWTLVCWAATACLQSVAMAGADELTPGAEPVVSSSVVRTQRIMPIGDSITKGSASRDSYRRPLWHRINDAGIDTDFVGSQNTLVPNPDFDLDHEAFSGWTADDFLRDGNIANWAQTYLPDIVLIHLGTNDMLLGQSVATTIDEIGQIIDAVRDANQEVVILVAQIIPASGSSRPSMVPLNEAIPGLVDSKDSATSPVRVVDQFTGFDATVDTYDGVHPNIEGEVKMARKWFDALQPFLGIASFTSTPVTEATQAIPYNYTATVEFPDAGTISITATENPEWLILVDNGDGTAVLSGTPGNADVGQNLVRLVADGPNDLTAEQVFTIDVADVNDAPMFTSAPVMVATEAVEYSYPVTIEDPDADTIRVTALTLPDWLTLGDNTNGTAMLTGTPAGADTGTHAVELQAEETSSAEGLAAQQSFTITVTAAPEGPVISLIGNSTVTIVQGDAYNDAGATANDTQDGDLTAQITTDNPVNSSVPATYTVTYSVSDSAGNEARAQRTVTVRAESNTAGQQSGGGGGFAGIFELLALLVVAAACRVPQARARRRPFHFVQPVAPATDSAGTCK
jgi:acyl-CoA thioesterase-1